MTETGVDSRRPVPRAVLALVAALPFAFTDVANAGEPREPAEADVRLTATSTVVRRAEIDARQWRTLVELLQSQPGLHVSQLGGIGQPVQLFVRGQRRGRVTVRLDGVDISDPASKDPGAILPDLLTVDIEQVAILRGPQAVLGGDDALGGIIDITTRRGSGPTTPWARAEAGAFGTYQSSAGIRGSVDDFDYSLSYTHLHSRGVDIGSRDGERDGYDNDSISGRVDFRLSEGLRLGVRGRFIDTERELDSGLVGPVDPTDPSPATFNLFDLRDSRRDARRLLLRGELELALFDDRWLQEWSVSLADHSTSGRVGSPVLLPAPVIRPAPIADSQRERTTSDADSSRLALGWTHTLQLAANHTLRFGGEIENETIRTRETNELGLVLSARLLPIFPPPLPATARVDSVSERVLSAHERARNRSAFIEDRFSLGDFFGEIGARVHDDDAFGSELAYRLGLGYLEPRSGAKLSASLGTAFRNPDLAVAATTREFASSRVTERTTGAVIQSASSRDSRNVVTLRGTGFGFGSGPVDVEAERVRAAEVSLQLPLLEGRGEAGLALFQTRSRRLASRGILVGTFDRVIAEFAEDSLESRTRGAELWLQLDLDDRMSVQLDYTYTRSRLGHDLGLLSGVVDVGGDPELGIPRHRANASIRYAPLDRLEGWLSVRYVGQRDDVVAALPFRVRGDAVVTRAFAPTVQKTIGGFTTVDVGLRFALRSNVALFARVANLFDREYGDPTFTSAPGRAGYVGVQIEQP